MSPKMYQLFGLVLAVGCAPAPVVWTDPNFQLQLLDTCSAADAGFERLDEQAEARGIDLIYQPTDEPRPCPSIPGGVVAQDLDDDGDIDLLFHRPEGFPYLYVNDGAGSFTPHDVPLSSPTGRRVEAQAAADVDGDGLPEVFIVGEGFAAVSRNRGGLAFDDFEVLFEQPEYPRTCIVSLGFGDADGDGDLDLVLPGADTSPYEGAVLSDDPWTLSGEPDRLLLNEGGRFGAPTVPAPVGDPGISLLAVLSDRDMDGDADLLLGTDRPRFGMPPMRFLRNDGPGVGGAPSFEDDTSAVGFALRTSAMGLDVADLNGDAWPDYTLSDEGGDLVALLSDGFGGWYDAGAALGLVGGHHSHPSPPEGWGWSELESALRRWTTWSVELVDLDNDGWDDLAVTAGEPPFQGNVALAARPSFQPDGLYRGGADGVFEDHSHVAGFNAPEGHYGLVSADLEGDGARELVVGVWEGRPQIWHNPCTRASMLEVDLVGPPGNREGFGAQVVVEVDGRLRHREVLGLRTVGQSPSSAHFGLGDAEQVDRLTIYWPDGTVTEAEDVPARRKVTAFYPME
ncbi:MAG: CRTAC1 family protein [Alphaproteobacteria bacterium]|nr:CRTAC1 family protein [Alphaproteobacteria bacterium]